MNYEEAFPQALEYFEGDEMAANVFLTKYALQGDEGDYLEPTPEAMHRRLAKEFARIEAKYPNPMSEEEIFGLMDRFKYIVPQGSPMAGIGNPYQAMSLSNCFVVAGPEDSYSGIMYTDQQQAQLMKRRGGVGFDISKLRPKGMNTNNAAKTTDGIGIFMDRFSNTTREVAQGGRRGALMLTISVHHPEIETFISIKNDPNRVTGANISIRLSDDFMNAVKNNDKYQLQWPVDSDNPVIVEQADAVEIWDKIIKSAHASAEPGLLFWDTVKRRSATDDYEQFQTVSTNPCGEITLSEYDSCRLLLVNTLSFVENPFTDAAGFDFRKFGEVASKAQRLMDDMVDLELEQIDKTLAKIDADPEPEHIKRVERELWEKIRWSCENGRRTGLGVTAIGDTVAALNMRYGSDQSIDMIENIYRELTGWAYHASIRMAEERGAFPVFDHDKEKDNEFINQMLSESSMMRDDYNEFGRRNIACTTTAPAGSVSILTRTTSGIEPVFMPAYTRRKKINPNDKNPKVDFVDNLGDKWTEFTVYHPGVQKWMEITGETDVKKSPYHRATANDIDWNAKVRAQAAAQKWIDHAISNTTNVPEDTSVETVKDIYMTGWESGCKGVTIYRDGSRSGVLINPESAAQKDNIVINDAPKRPVELDCTVHHMTVMGEKWMMFVGMLNGRPYELMGGLSKYVTVPKRVTHGKIVKHNGETNPARYDFHYDYEEDPENETIIRDLNNGFENATHAAFTRTISLALRHGAPVRYVVEQIQKGSEKEDELFSFSKAASRVLKHYIEDGIAITGKSCQDCGSDQLIYEEGCAKCTSCGSSKCG